MSLFEKTRTTSILLVSFSASWKLAVRLRIYGASLRKSLQVLFNLSIIAQLITVFYNNNQYLSRYDLPD
jgi:hypothetical protein